MSKMWDVVRLALMKPIIEDPQGWLIGLSVIFFILIMAVSFLIIVCSSFGLNINNIELWCYTFTGGLSFIIGLLTGANLK